MKWSDEQMYARFQESDATCNGQFWVGVLTTGIYCLPSCHARKALLKNVRFFPSVQAAATANLRPCRQCHPDDFAKGLDPLLMQIETLAREARQDPGRFPDPSSLVRRSGFGPTRLFELFRQHYQMTPGEFLLRCRLAAAQKRLIDDRATISETAESAGYRSLSTFHEQFRTRTGLSPAAYRRLNDEATFTLELPRDYDLGCLKKALSRDAHSATERWENDLFSAVVRTSNGPCLLRLKLHSRTIEVLASRGESVELHRLAARLLGFEQDPRPFEKLVAKLRMPNLIAGRKGLRIAQTPSVFDGLIWAIAGQHINFSFAGMLKRRLTQLAGEPFHEDLFAPPTPEQVAALAPTRLLKAQFSRQKAECLIEVSKKIVSGELNLNGLSEMSATRAMRTLLSLKGLGPWSVNYVMMRSLGFLDCLPVGDTGLASGLERLFEVERPDPKTAKKLMAPFSPYRSLATAHLWRSAHEQP